MNACEQIKNIENGVVTFDSDYTPELAFGFPLFTQVKEPVSFLIVEVNSEDNSHPTDPMISIVVDNDHNREIINQSSICKIIGSGSSDIAIPALMYGLQHPTRILYKNTMSKFNEFIANIGDKFNDDDALLRGLLNTLS